MTSALTFCASRENSIEEGSRIAINKTNNGQEYYEPFPDGRKGKSHAQIQKPAEVLQESFTEQGNLTKATKLSH